MLDLINTILSMAVPAAGVGISIYATTIRTKAALDYQSRELSRLEARMEQNVQETKKELDKLIRDHHILQIESIQNQAKVAATLETLARELNHLRGEMLELPEQFAAMIQKK